MTNAYVLMTAMPPTKGHLHLIQFASSLASHAHVILCTQPDEPFWAERLLALQKATQSLPNVLLHHIHKTLPQEPEQDPGFWGMWGDFLRMFGFQVGDYIVASETYGIKLAEETKGVFMPYDIARSVYDIKATEVRSFPVNNFRHILPEFQPFIRKTVTVFGAESTGKTTLSKCLANDAQSVWLPEWARPYLETVGTELNTQVMTNIWQGQLALQRQGQMLRNVPFVVQDTDLFSTIGYWLLHLKEYGRMPRKLSEDAESHKSDLYIITKSNIPFEEDPLRYGGKEREASDQFWIDICEHYRLNYVVLNEDNLQDRIDTGLDLMYDLFEGSLTYTRITKETLGV